MNKILISSCLLGHYVRYDAGTLTLPTDDLEWLRRHFEVIPVCPEVAGGLPTPRAPVEINTGDGADVIDGRAKVISIHAVDVTSQFLTGARLVLSQCQTENIRYAILTEASPSCGSQTIYDGTFTGIKKSGQGVTSALLTQHGIRVFSQYQIGLLKQLINSEMSQGSDNV